MTAGISLIPGKTGVHPLEAARSLDFFQHPAKGSFRATTNDY